jgi:hypothetical protein
VQENPRVASSPCASALKKVWVDLCGLCAIPCRGLPPVAPLRPPLFEEVQGGREKLQALEFFDMADDSSSVHAQFAGYGGIGRGVRRGGLLEVALESQIDRKPIHTNLRHILIKDTVLNLNVRIGCGVARSARVHTTPFQGTALERTVIPCAEALLFPAHFLYRNLPQNTRKISALARLVFF